MVTKVYLIRHGETEDSCPKRYKGHIDAPLSENGIRQIKTLSAHLTENGTGGSGALSAVYCSDLGRAVRSAEIIAEPCGLKPVAVSGLKERNFGVWEGMTFDEIREKWPDAFANWAADPLKHTPPGGESTIDVRERIWPVFDSIIGKHAGETIAIVSHGGVTRILLCELLGMPLNNIFRIEQDFACLNVIKFHDQFPVVRLINGRPYG